MPTTIEIKGILEEKLELLIKAGLYASKTEAVRDGIRKLLENQDFLSITLNLYRDNKISTGRAAEIANLTVAEFIFECQRRGVPLNLGTESIEDIEDELKMLRDKSKRIN